MTRPEAVSLRRRGVCNMLFFEWRQLQWVQRGYIYRHSQLRESKTERMQRVAIQVESDHARLTKVSRVSGSKLTDGGENVPFSPPCSRGWTVAFKTGRTTLHPGLFSSQPTAFLCVVSLPEVPFCRGGRWRPASLELSSPVGSVPSKRPRAAFPPRSHSPSLDRHYA